MTMQMAIAGILLVTFLWGSWFQTVKHIGNVPVHAFISIMYGISVLIVWLSIAILGDQMIPNGVFREIGSSKGLALAILVCGVVFGVAMQMQLTVVKRIGLILSTSVSATCSILGGTAVSVIFAGIPEGVSVWILFFAALLLILATILCQYAGVCRDKDRNQEQASQASRMGDILLLVFINLVLMSSYPLANSIGLRSTMNPNGFSSLTCMGILVLGACAGSWGFTWILLRKEQGKLKTEVMKQLPMKKLIGLASVAALCHFGGNVLHAIVAPVVSVSIATGMGNCYHGWSYVWGLAYGEFRGAGRKTYCLLGIGILLFAAGVILLSREVV